MTEAATEDKTNTETKTDGDLGTIEERAQRMGWTPKEKFRGDPDRWVDAATFVKNGEESLPILRERLRKLEQTNVDLSKTAAEFKTKADENFDKGYEKAKRELQAEIKAKAKEGDAEGAAAAANELAGLEREKAAREAKSDADPVFDGWVANNDWYKDPDLSIEAEAIAFKLRKKGEKAEGVEFLEKVKEAMKKQFPEKFGNPRRQAGSGVERSSAGGEETASRGKKGWEHLPAEAKEAGDRYIKQKFFKDRSEYAARYWAQEG